jgi:hypothetical protein
MSPARRLTIWAVISFPSRHTCTTGVPLRSPPEREPARLPLDSCCLAKWATESLYFSVAISPAKNCLAERTMPWKPIDAFQTSSISALIPPCHASRAVSSTIRSKKCRAITEKCCKANSQDNARALESQEQCTAPSPAPLGKSLPVRAGSRAWTIDPFRFVCRGSSNGKFTRTRSKPPGELGGYFLFRAR